MPITIELPRALQPHAQGSPVVVLDEPCATVGDALTALASQRPGLMDRVLDERGELRPHVNVFVGQESIRFSGGLDSAVSEGGTITIVPAVSGG
jgi:molybdopterin synthase sulfur carrier subunit